jgi:APA family basic amino acid/polyamine antiporter
VGVRESATFNGIMVLVKTSIVILVILFGLPYVHFSNLSPFLPPNQGTFGKFGVSGVLAASGMIFFAYIGFEAVSVAAQEARNPRRDLPIGILGSLGICTVLYIFMAIVLLGVTNWRLLDVPNPVSFAIGKIGPLSWLVPLINVGAVAGLATVVFVSLYGQSRVFYSMARDGFIGRAFCAVHPRFHTPHIGTIIIGVAAGIGAALLPLDILADLVSIGTLLAFVAVCGGIMILRRTAPRARRPFRTPFVWFVAPTGIAICGLMMFSLSDATWVRLVLWTAIGLAIYFLYGVWHAAPWKWKVANEGG